MAWPELSWIERFAPSPTGPLHLGHAYSALTAWDRAVENGGEFLLRIEDIDQSRCRPEWEVQIFEDLEWLGIWWPKPVLRQSERSLVYQKKIEKLWQQHALFACSCSRKDILDAPQEGTPILGSDGVVYPGTCSANIASPGDVGIPKNTALRLNMSYASSIGYLKDGKNCFSFVETGCSPEGQTGLIEFSADEAIETIGDIVLARRDMGTSYHLSVVLDDAFQGVTHVTRGQDLFEATKIHVILQKLLGLPTPVYHHHALIRDENGKRLAKRDDARAISKYRAEGATPQDIRYMVGL
ncbi:MAG: tRNA glutamyl-Q(34) synthetase GluQRS [Rhodobacteraceae bacterium]|nr:tRNA glutamyl-Q(34) synthetase GluQRS [Paracoccaceae bacterium]